MDEVIQTQYPPDIYYFNKAMKLLYCEPPFDPDVIAIYIMNIYAGYDDLIRKVEALVGKQKFKGNPVSLAIINGRYYTLCGKEPSNVDLDKDPIKVKAAIFQAWKTQNPGYAPTEFSEILE